ncbi:phosphatase PAP2 family protein [Ramlibacter pallidus]|uniref:phosphatase PAP2 family protein n=1 Tax=Ramlibacter pallidus TaxID=2780087 RepID=UPI00338EE6AA
MRLSSRAWLAVAAGLLVFAFFALQLLLQGPFTRLDHQLAQWFAAHRTGWLNAMMLFVADAHETEKVLAATAVLAAWRAWRHDGADLRLLAVVPAGMLVNLALKHAFQRDRPVLEDPLVHLTTYSFPSGHAVASTVFYGALCLLAWHHARAPGLRAAAAAGAAAMVLLVCASRVYLGAHYLSDVIAGVAVGTLCVVAFQHWRSLGRLAPGA